MDHTCSQSICPVCGGDYRLSQRGIRERWPRWLCAFLLVWSTWVLWQSTGLSEIGALRLRVLFGGGAAIAWVVTLALWVFVDGGRDADRHKRCLRANRRMWLVPPLFALACVVGALSAGGLVYLAVWALQWMRHSHAG